MTQIQVPSGQRPVVRHVPSPAVRRNHIARYFFPAAAAIFFVFTFLGFSPYFTQGLAYPHRPIAPPMKTVILVHAIVMSIWMLLLLAQPSLVLTRKTKVHMMMGKFGAVVATLVVASGLAVAIRAVQTSPADAPIWGIPPIEFFIVPFTSAIFFGVFTALAIIKRKKPTTHRVLIVLGTLTIMSAPISRIDPLNNLYLGTVWERLFGPLFMTMVLAVLLVIAHWGITQKLDRTFAIGTAIVIALSLAVWQLASTPAWISFASLFV